MLLIYSDIRSARLSYILDMVFNELMNVHYQITFDSTLFKDYPGEKVSYGKEKISGEFFIRRVDLLIEGPVMQPAIDVLNIDSNLYVFPVLQPSDLPFDIFAAAFFMISRYEEYLPFKPDKHGRFSSSSGIAAKYHFLQRPVVNEWIIELGHALKQKFPGLIIKPAKFSEIISYDIDVAYEFKGRGILRRFASTVKDLFKLDVARIKARIQVNNGSIDDPYDTYQYILESSTKHNLQLLFFFLVGNYSSNDKNLEFDSVALKGLVKYISRSSDIGLHPSYLSSLNANLITLEKKRLESIAGKPIHKSRQHFLKLTLPHTYRNLLTAGITEDYTMGFADAPGFRAGTCTPFFFYDLEKEKVTTLKVFPTTFMEGNFIKYLQMKPSEAMTVISDLIQKVNAVNGKFISLWHNHTLSNRGIYKGWKIVHDTMLNEISMLKDNNNAG